MPTPIRATARGAMSAGKPTSYVKFSDKLTDSIDDIQKIIESHKQWWFANG